jgi:hypothetical protein
MSFTLFISYHILPYKSFNKLKFQKSKYHSFIAVKKVSFDRKNLNIHMIFMPIKLIKVDWFYNLYLVLNSIS